jgi:2-polyprenyl-3-methyl-5-hydroxy-6-metoxy-1,4-benzoquinol methylase
MADHEPELTGMCPVCGGSASLALTAEDYHYGNPGRFKLYCCDDCQHRFQFPTPEESELLRYYPKEYYSFQPPQSDFTPRGLRHRGVWLTAHYRRLCRGYRHLELFPNPLLAFLGWWLIGKDRDLAAPRFIPGGTLCDFGCGSGSSVAVSQYFGWDAEGIEVSEAAVAAGKSAGLKITQGSIEALESRCGAFDFIGSHHCVEHVPDVSRLFRAFYTALKPGGTLVIEVPNADSAALHIYGEMYYYLTLPVHIHLFSHRSLDLLAARSRFTNITTKAISHWFSHAASWLLGRDVRKGRASPRFNSHTKWARVLARVPSLASFLRSTGDQRGDCLVLVCNRPKE